MNEFLLERDYGVSDTNKIVDGLLGVMEGCVEDTMFGICYNWSEALRGDISRIDTYELVNMLAIGWPKHSGVEVYPVPQTRSSQDAYPLWEGEQLKLRQDLMHYMLTQLIEYRGSL